MLTQFIEFDNRDYLVKTYVGSGDEKLNMLRSFIIDEFNDFTRRYQYSSIFGCNNPKLVGDGGQTQVSLGDLVEYSLDYGMTSGSCRTCLLDLNLTDVKGGVNILKGSIYKKPTCKIKNLNNNHHFQIEFRISKVSTRIQVTKVKIRTTFEFKSFVEFKFEQNAHNFKGYNEILKDIEIDKSLRTSSIRVNFPGNDNSSSASFVGALSKNGIELLIGQNLNEKPFLKNDSDDLSTLLSVFGACLNPLKYTLFQDLLRSHSLEDIQRLNLVNQSEVKPWPFESIRCNQKMLQSFIDSARGGKGESRSLLQNMFIVDEGEKDNSVLLIVDESIFWRR